MKTALVVLPLIALIVVVIIGPLSMLHAMDGHTDCPIAAVANIPCLSFGTVTDHIAGFQNLLTAIPVSAVFALLFALLFLAFLFLDALPSAERLRRVSATILGDPFPRLRWTALRWQARLTHSPTAS